MSCDISYLDVSKAEVWFPRFYEFTCTVLRTKCLIKPVTSSRDAWSAQHGLSRTEAKRRYISTLIETMHQYASTTREARELVAELEFVWDQIKSNSVSSASSPGRNQDLVSPLQSTQPVPASTEPAAANYAGGGGDGDSGALRMFRPVTSDTDQESEDGKEARYRMTRRDSLGSPPEGAGRRSKLTCEEYHQRNRKVMSSIKQMLSNITQEIATLREHLEARTTGGSSGLQASHGNHYPWNHPRRGRWGRLVVFIMATARHLIIDAVALGVLLWLWRSDERVRHVVTSMIQLVRKRIRRVEEVWRRRLV